MAAMNFPSSPVDGQTYTNPDTGVIYTYNSADGKWKTSVTSNAFLPLSGGTLSGALNVTDIKHASSASNNIVLSSDGTTTIAAPSNIIKSGTAVASTSGTAIDFTGLPSWVKRITVMFSGVSLSGTSSYLLQLGDSGGIESTGYTSTSVTTDSGGGSAGVNSTSGYVWYSDNASYTQSGLWLITNVSGNTWVSMHQGRLSTTNTVNGGGTKTLSDTLTQVRITTVNGTDTFDAGTVNILYEG